MECYFCGKKFIILDKFIIHLEYVHNAKYNFICPIVDCKRSFHRRFAYKKHIITKHSLLRSGQQSSMNISKHTANITTSTCFFSNETGSCDKSENVKEEEPFDIHSKYKQFTDTLNISVIEFISSLNSNMSLNRTVIQDILQNVIKLFSSSFLDIILDCIEHSFRDTETSVILKIMIEMLKKIWEKFGTEHKRYKYFSTHKNFIEPIQYTVGTTTDNSRKNNEVSLVLKNRTAVHVSVKKTLLSFFSIPNVFDEIVKYQNNILPNDPLFTILQGKLWKNIVSNYSNKIVMPLVLYYDDFETCNPLGSHAGVYKLGALYFTIASIPPKYARRIENIFLALLFHSQDRVTYGNRSVFEILLKELKELETEGLLITSNGVTFNVCFVVLLIVGDNLGIHFIFGYPECFVANYCCRFCTENKENIRKLIDLKVESIREVKDYADHVANNSFGIKEACIWNDLNYFHVYTNLSCDVMHDLFEGMYRYDMALIINHYIKLKCFSLTILNFRIQYFNYNHFEKNIPPTITKESLTNGSIIFSASEMLCLVRNFNLIIGDLVPQADEVWQFYLVLKQINDIVTATQISSSMLKYLKHLISEHHHMFLRYLIYFLNLNFISYCTIQIQYRI